MRETEIGFWMDIYMKESLCKVLGGFTRGGKFVLGFGWAYTRREVCVRFWVGLYTEGSLCEVLGWRDPCVRFWVGLYMYTE